MYQKRFLRLCFTNYESASNLPGPASLEAQSADKRAWEIIAELVNQHAWKLDDALHEMSEVRADLSSLLAPRATLPKQLLNHQEDLASEVPRSWPWGQEQRRLPLCGRGPRRAWRQRRQALRQRQGRGSSWQVAFHNFHGRHARTLPLAASFIAALSPSPMAQPAGTTARRSNMLQRPTRTRFSNTREIAKAGLKGNFKG